MTSSISIVIPTLNEEANLPKVLDLLRSESDNIKEIIVVDGYSKDKTVDIAKQRLKDLSTLPGPDNGDGWAPEALEGLIEFEDVSFGYNPGSYVFENTNIRIEPGEMVLIHGDNWSGKSTFLSLVAQIVTPDEGRILVDGIDVRDVDERWLRSQIAYLPQTPALFEGTLWENLTGFCDDCLAG